MQSKKKFWLILLPTITIGFAGLVFYFTSVKTIDQRTFVKFYSDYLIAQDSLGSDVASSKKIRETLYKKYSVTEEEYLSTINDYNADQKKWAEFFGKVMEELADRQKKNLPKK